MDSAVRSVWRQQRGERIFLNGAEIAEYQGCKTTTVAQGRKNPPSAQCVLGTPSETQTGCAINTESRANQVETLQSDARVLLCCEAITP